MAISDRDLLACQVKQLPGLAVYDRLQCGLQAATAALAAAGNRAARDNHHYRVIQIAGVHYGTGPKIHRHGRWLSQEAQCVQLRSSWAISDKEADEMFKLSISLRDDVEKWIRATRSQLFKPKV